MANTTFNYSKISDLKDVDSYLWDLIKHVTDKNIGTRKNPKTLKDTFTNGAINVPPEKVLAHEININEVVAIITSYDVKNGINILEENFTLAAKNILASGRIFQSTIGEQEFLNSVKNLMANNKTTFVHDLNDIIKAACFYDKLKELLIYITQQMNVVNVIIADIGSTISVITEQLANEIICDLKANSLITNIINKICNNNALTTEEELNLFTALLNMVIEKLNFSGSETNDALSRIKSKVDELIKIKHYENICINVICEYSSEYQYRRTQTNNKILGFIKNKLGLKSQEEAEIPLLYYLAKLQNLDKYSFLDKYKNEFNKYSNDKDLLISQLIIESSLA